MRISIWAARTRVTLVSSALLVAIAILLIASVPHQRIHIDESWLGEQSYWQAHDGVRRSELFRGLLDYENHIYVAHKLFILVGAMFVKVFGWHLWALRLVPLLSGATLLFLLYLYFRRNREEDSKLALLVALLYLTAAPMFFQFVNLYRPEIPLAAFGFGSFLLIAEYVRSERLSHLLGAATLAGISVLIHLNGVIYVGAGALALFRLRRWKHLVSFIALAGAISLFYFYDVIGHSAEFWYQFRSDPALDKSDLAWYAPLWRLINEHKRLFRKPDVIFASSLFFASLWYYWKTSTQSNRWIAVYAAALVVGLGAFAQGKTVAYTILLLPVSAIIVAGATGRLLGKREKIPKTGMVVAIALWVLFLGHSFFGDSMFALTQKRDVAASNHETASFIPAGATVLAPLDFVFEEIGNYQIRGDEAAGWILKQGHPEIGDIHKSLNAPDFLRYANDREIDAVIIEDYLFSRIGQSAPGIGDTVTGFVAVGKVDELSRTVFLRSGQIK